jgi:hypothetical protein
MTTSQIHRLSGLGLLVGAVVFVAHIALRSLVTAGSEPAVFATKEPWILLNALGLLGAVLVLFGLPAMHARLNASTGVLGLLGVMLIALAWLFFGVFLSLYSMLILPWLAERAPSLVAASAPVATGVLLAFVAGLATWVLGTVLLGIPLVRTRIVPRWAAYSLPVSAVWMLLGNLVIAPSGPAASVAINLLSNLGPVLLLIALGHVGYRMWSDASGANTPTGPLDRDHLTAKAPS